MLVKYNYDFVRKKHNLARSVKIQGRQTLNYRLRSFKYHPRSLETWLDKIEVN